MNDGWAVGVPFAATGARSSKPANKTFELRYLEDDMEQEKYDG